MVWNIGMESTTKSQKYFYPLVEGESHLKTEYIKRKRSYENYSIAHHELENYLNKGWVIQKKNRTNVRVKRDKKHFARLEDNIWCLLYSMGYGILNGKNFKISFKRDSGAIHSKQVDVYAEDEDTVFVVECKSRLNLERRSLQKDLSETSSLQNNFRQSIHTRYTEAGKKIPKILWIYATNNIVWSNSDRERARDFNIHIITENDLRYFEAFIKHMGPAGKYQILGHFLRDQKIVGLQEIKLPAVTGKIGGHRYYNFVCTPRNLLKIAFVNHHAFNYEEGKPAYQRMISAGRINKIGEYIKQGGFFPTNLLINFPEKVRFDKISNKHNSDSNIKFGWLTLPSKFCSAWVIDGQHRLFGFSKLKNESLDQSLFVLAFEELPKQMEANLFITINHEQKSVPKSLLVSLLADLKKGDSDPSTALSAMASEIVNKLNLNSDSPFYSKFATPGVPANLPQQSLTISEVAKGIKVSKLLGQVVKKDIIAGSLSVSTDEQTIEKTILVLNGYFDKLRNAHPQRWNNGKNSYISTNPGIRAHLLLIAEVIKYLTHKKSLNFNTLNANSAKDKIIDFCEPIFLFIAKSNEHEIESNFARKFGEGGVKEYYFNLMRILHTKDSDFGSEEFHVYIEQNESEKIDQDNQFILKLVENLTNYVIENLKIIHGDHNFESGWKAFWQIGIKHKGVREKCFKKQQEDADPKPLEAYLDLVDLEPIVKQSENWIHFASVFNNALPDEQKNKKYYLKWLFKFNELRKIAAHPNSLKTYNDEDFEFIEWLRSEVSPKVEK